MESNHQPADYKAAALPIKLHQRTQVCSLESAINTGCLWSYRPDLSVRGNTNNRIWQNWRQAHALRLSSEGCFCSNYASCDSLALSFLFKLGIVVL